MARRDRLTVLFHAAAGARRGYGHLMRCGVLADALGADRHLSLRGAADSAAVARSLGWTVYASAADALTRCEPDLIVIDDPSVATAGRLVRLARRTGIPVASIHDLGRGQVDSDLSIDGSLATLVRAGTDLRGPAYAVLHPSVSAWRRRGAVRGANRVLITLGGGAHVRAMGAALADAIVALAPDVTIDIAAGFARGRRPALPSRCRWIDAPDGLARGLACATVALVGGGVTLYEAAALGTPAVAVPVVRAQRPTILAFASAGAAVGVLTPRAGATVGLAAWHVADLLTRPAAAARLGRSARALIDGAGAGRVAARLRALVAGRTEVRDAVA